MPESVQSALWAGRPRVDAALRALCSDRIDDLAPRVAEAIQYALLGEGKRFRGLLVLAAYEGAGGSRDVAPLAAAVEVVHAYSLVHDDLPCMDDDDVRRGRPTVHKAFGVRVATVAGLAMVPLAARAAFRAGLQLGLRNEEAAELVRILMRASGAGGMIGGQWLDLDAEGQHLELGALERMHRAKTGALITASVLLGGLSARARPDVLTALTTYGDALGLAFQIADDVLDVTATTHELGKTAGKDAALGKSTYAAVLGVSAAMERASRLAEEGCAALSTVNLLTPQLRDLASYVVARRS